MTFICPSEFISFAHELADASRPIIQHYFRRSDLDITVKSEDQPVTKADRETEEKLRDLIAQHYPDHGIWGEEYGRSNADAEFTWILDPVDGTKAFTLGRPTFACLIGLHHRQHGFIAGIADQAIGDLRYAGAQGYAAICNNQKISAAKNETLKNLRLSITNPVRLTGDFKKLHDTLLSQVGFIHYGGDALNFAGIADGRVHATFETSQNIYDVAALIPIIEAAGGKITQGDGTEIDLAMGKTILAACTPDLHAQLLDMMSA